MTDYKQKNVRDLFHETLVDGVRAAVAVLKKAKPDISKIELAVCLYDEFEEFMCDFEDMMDTLVNDDTISTLSAADITALHRGIYGVLGGRADDDEEDPDSDAATFSYENALKYMQAPRPASYGRCAETEPVGGGIMSTYSCDPTIYMDEIDATTALEALAKLVEKAPKGPSLNVAAGIIGDSSGACAKWMAVRDELVSNPRPLEKTPLQNTTVISNGDAKPVWWTTDTGERAGCYDLYIPVMVQNEAPRVLMPVLRDVEPVSLTDSFTTNTTGWEDRKMETPRVEMTKTTLGGVIRTLSDRWTLEAVQDVGIVAHDIEEELLAVLAEEINREAEAGRELRRVQVLQHPITKVLPMSIADDIVGIKPVREPSAEPTPPVNFMTRYGYVDIETPEMPKLRRVEMKPVALTPNDMAARGDHTHAERNAITIIPCETPVHPMQSVNRADRKKSSIEVQSVSFR